MLAVMFLCARGFYMQGFCDRQFRTMDQIEQSQLSQEAKNGQMSANAASPDDEVPPTDKAQEMRKRMEAWLNQPMRIRMTDGRTLVGTFLCTDKDKNVILGSCEEYVNPLDSDEKEEPRVLGLAMVPGQHIVSIEVDQGSQSPL